MSDFAAMPFDTLLTPEGHTCDCGRRHQTDLRYLHIGSGAIGALPNTLASIGARRPFIIMDENTQRAAWEKTRTVLEGAGVRYTMFCFDETRLEPDEHAMGALTMAYDPASDGILAIGSGVLNDCATQLAHVTGRPSAVLCTAPSMDGYASSSSSMIKSGVKTTLYNVCPRAIIADTDIVRMAPERMLRAGLGDMLAKYVSICEWRIDAAVNGAYYCESIASLVRSGVRQVASNADQLMRREPAAVEAVMKGLVLSGVAMGFAQNSRPASGLEHYFSHIWEMMAIERGEASDLHGIQVGVGTWLTRQIYQHLMRIKPDITRAQASVRSFDDAAWRADIRRVFRGRADELFAARATIRQHDPDRHAMRLSRIDEDWDTLLGIMRDELPELSRLKALMQITGMPMLPADIGISAQDTRDALRHARDIRDKYTTASLLWDLGLLDEAENWLDLSEPEASE